MEGAYGQTTSQMRVPDASGLDESQVAIGVSGKSDAIEWKHCCRQYRTVVRKKGMYRKKPLCFVQRPGLDTAGGGQR